MFPEKFQRNNGSVLLVASVVITIIVILFIFALINSNSGQDVEGGDITSDNMSSENTSNDTLQVQVVQKGEGYKSQVGDMIEVHYTGKLQDGTVFDSSITRNESFEFELGAGMVIQGWDMGLLDVNKGTKLVLTIPPYLGYGDAYVGDIPANSTLIFDIEVLDVKKAE